MSFQFHYTPPPEEVVRNGQWATYALYTAMLAVPKVWLGALIGGLGSALITLQVIDHAKGEGAFFSMLVEVPTWAFIGALVSGGASLINKTIRRRLRHTSNSQTISAEPEESKAR